MNIDAGKYWDKAWQLVDGCSPVSAGCDNCWSASMTHRFKQGLTNIGKFNGKIKLREDRLDLPLKTKKPTVWAIWNDLCHENVPDKFINSALAVMSHCRNHTFLLLTKRPCRLERFFKGVGLLNVWCGTSIENQQTADERIPHLLQVPGKKFLSIEPMLGSIDLRRYLASALGENYPYQPAFAQIICGSESGHNKRPTNIEWVENLVEQCTIAKIPIFIKQLDINGKTSKDINDWPDKLRRRDLIWKI